MKKLILTFILFIFIHITYGQIVNFETKIFLEGAFNGIDMNADLYAAGVIPISQPYNIEPWNYEGTETISASPETDIVDWVLIELRETYGDSSTTSSDKFLDHQAALLLSDGSIVQPDGISLLNYSGTITQNLYIIVYHRNHLPVMSAIPLVNIGDTYEYDFTDALSKAYLDGQKALSGGMFGMIGGNSDGNRAINSNDIDISWSNDAGNYGYYGGDANMDTKVNNIDKNDVWEVNKDSISPVTMSCGIILDDRDGQLYHSVLIGEQCWMVSNLNIGIMINGLDDQIDNDTIEKYCYDDDTINCAIYGGLYQWNEMMGYVSTWGVKGLCPDGWHIPAYGEFETLSEKVNFSGNALKAIGQGTGIGAGTNTSGFSALLAGYRDNDGVFKYLDGYAHFWSSKENYATHSFSMFVFSDNKKIWISNSSKENGYSVRCMKN